MKKIYLAGFSSAFAIFVVPLVSVAAEDLGDITSTFEKITTFISSTLIPLVFAVALLMFLIGVFKYFIMGGGDEGKRAEGRQMMLYSIIGFVAMVSIFGIVNIVAGGLGLNDAGDKTIDLPGTGDFKVNTTNTSGSSINI